MGFSPSAYVPPAIDTDPSAIASRAKDRVAEIFTGWEPNALDEAIFDAFSQEAAEQADVLAALLTEQVFRSFGQLVGCPPIDAQPAQAQVTVTLRDSAGYTVPNGSLFGVRDLDGNLQGFASQTDLVVAPGASTGVVTAICETDGTIGNSLSGVCELVQVPNSVIDATMATSSRGLDAEDGQTYLGRLAETLTLLRPTPVLAPDFALVARTVPGVWRATAVDNLKPGPPYDSAPEDPLTEKCVTVAAVDVTGADVGPAIRANVKAHLQSLREWGFRVFAVAPVYRSVDVVATGVCWPGWDAADVQARAQAAVAALLSPLFWGTDATGNNSRWVNSPILRLADVYRALMTVPGVRYIDALTFAPTGGSPAIEDGDRTIDSSTGTINGAVLNDIALPRLGATINNGTRAIDASTGTIDEATLADVVGGANSTTHIDLAGGSAVPALPLAGTLSISIKEA